MPKANLTNLDLSAAFSAINKTLETEARDMTHDQFDEILSGAVVNGYVFAGKALSKKLAGADVGLVLVKDTESGKELWLGIADGKDTVFSGARLGALEWKIGLALGGQEE